MPPYRFEIAEHTLNGTHVIELSGEVDLVTAPDVADRLNAAIRDGKMKIVIDCTAVTFMDSKMMETLYQALGRLRQHGGELAVVCADERLRRLFEILGLDALMPVRDTREDAVASLA